MVTLTPTIDVVEQNTISSYAKANGIRPSSLKKKYQSYNVRTSLNGGEKVSTIDLKLHLKPWDKEADTKMMRMLSGNANASPAANGNIDISIN